LLLIRKWLVRATTIIGTLAVVATPAFAQKEQIAETLFQEGKRLMAEGKYAEACLKLGESHKTDPGAGSLTALALCHKSEGKLASAWIEFREVLSLARRDNRKDREQVAQENLADIEPRLSRLRISLAPEADNVRDLEVRLDDVVMSRAAIGQLVPIDGGPHKVTARASGKLPYETSVTVAAEKDLVTVAVPALKDAPKEVATKANDPKEGGGGNRGMSAQRALGYTLGAAGLGAAAVGGVFGVRALSLASDADDLCPTSRCANQEAVDRSSDAVTSANISNILLGTGAVLVVTGLVLIVTSPSSSSPPTSAKRRSPFALTF